MTVVSYSIEAGAVQRDGRLSIVERYYDALAVEKAVFCTLVESKDDLDTLAVARMAEINATPMPRMPDEIEAKLVAALMAYQRGDIAAAKVAIADAKSAVDVLSDAEVL